MPPTVKRFLLVLFLILPVISPVTAGEAELSGRDRVAQAISDYLESAWGEGNVVWSYAMAEREIPVPEDAEVSIVPGKRPCGSTVINLDILRGGRLLRRIPVSVRVTAFAIVPVAAVDLSRHRVISTEDIRWEKRDVTRVNRSWLENESGFEEKNWRARMRVRAGQILARLDDTLARLTVERLRLVANEKHSLAEARIRLEQAQADYQRDSTLYAKGALASAELEASRRKFKLAEVILQRVQYQRALAAIELKQAEKRLADHTIRAPIDGIVLTRHRETGEAVDADTQTPLFTLIDVSRLRVKTMVPVEKVEQVHLGQPATVTPEVFPDLTVPGRVAVIRPMVSAKVNRFEVKVEFADPGGRIRPGMRATVRILRDR